MNNVTLAQDKKDFVDEFESVMELDFTQNYVGMKDWIHEMFKKVGEDRVRSYMRRSQKNWEGTDELSYEVYDSISPSRLMAPYTKLFIAGRHFFYLIPDD